MEQLQHPRRRILVTGASSGIGRATAIAASKRGDVVALVGRNAATLAETLQSLDGSGHIVVPFDLADLEGTVVLVRDIAERLGGLDTVIHSAGIRTTLPLAQVRPDSVREMFETNVISAMMLAKGFRHKLIPKRDATMVLISSTMGLVGQSAVSGYAASKGAVISLTKSLAIEMARDGIRVNCVCPGVVMTDMTGQFRLRVGEDSFRTISDSHPLGLGTPEDVANAILFLASHESRWITGTSLVVDGGYTAR